MIKKTFEKEINDLQMGKNSIIINGKIFSYDCSQKHTHNGLCLTQEMIDALSEEVYDA